MSNTTKQEVDPLLKIAVGAKLVGITLFTLGTWGVGPAVVAAASSVGAYKGAKKLAESA